MRTYIFNRTGNKVEREGTPDCGYMSIFEDDVICFVSLSRSTFLKAIHNNTVRMYMYNIGNM